MDKEQYLSRFGPIPICMDFEFKYSCGLKIILMLLQRMGDQDKINTNLVFIYVYPDSINNDFLGYEYHDEQVDILTQYLGKLSHNTKDSLYLLYKLNIMSESCQNGQ